ncbi:MAG: hypothetical protein Q4C64_02365 [Erysipelotrichia bacterium]|nr:hypothetical protein [Erysipelotrichia bacterium]
MDLLYHRYASPFNYLQGLMDSGNLLIGINYLFEQENERKLWDLYLHSYPSESFEKWKKKVMTNVDRPKELSQKEITIEINKSSEILKSFSVERG